MLPLGVAATGVLGMLGAAVGGSVLFVRHTAAGRIFTVATVPSAPAALVLGAQVHPDGTPSAFLAARLDLATQLYRAGKVKLILVSGASTAPEYDEPQAMRSYLIDAGIPESQVIIDNAGIDTYSSCVRAREIFGVSDLIVVHRVITYHGPWPPVCASGSTRTGSATTVLVNTRDPGAAAPSAISWPA